MPAEVFSTATTHPSPEAIDRAAEVISSGGIALFPTDTVYTVASLAVAGRRISGGVARLRNFKRRGFGPSFPWLVTSAADLDVYGMDVSDDARRLAQAFWPGGLSIVVHASSAVPRSLAHRNGSIALRLSASPVVSAIISLVDRPLVSTGANEHGAPPPTAFSDIVPEILDAVDVALDGGDAEGAGHSTVVDCTGTQPRILREGVVSRAEVDEAMGYRTPLV